MSWSARNRCSVSSATPWCACTTRCDRPARNASTSLALRSALGAELVARDVDHVGGVEEERDEVVGADAAGDPAIAEQLDEGAQARRRLGAHVVLQRRALAAGQVAVAEQAEHRDGIWVAALVRDEPVVPVLRIAG